MNPITQIQRGFTRSLRAGFTATEVMIAVAIVSIVMLGIFTLYIGQHSSYVHQQEILQLQQQMRTALNKIVKEVRTAGYDPAQINDTTPSTFGIQTAQANLIYYTADTNANGLVDVNEKYRFRVNSNKVEYSYNNGASWQPLTWQSLVAAVEAVSVNFAYYDANGAVTAVVQDIRVVRITLTERVRLSGIAAMYHTKTLSSRVELRNIQ